MKYCRTALMSPKPTRSHEQPKYSHKKYFRNQSDF